MATFRVYVLLLIYLTVAAAVVHKIQTRHHSLSSKQANGLFNLRSLRHQITHRRRFGIQASVGKLPLQDVFYLTTGNITVGTPAQSFNVEVDAFSENDLWLIGSNVNLSSANDNNPKKQTYNANKSTSYVPVSGDIDMWGVKGHKAQDALNIGPLSAPVKFIVLDELPYFLDYFPIDGILGLSPSQNNPANVSKVVDELVGQLDNPIISVYVNQTAGGNGTGQVTVGAEDSDNCNSEWSYVPTATNSDRPDFPFTIHVSSAEVTINGTVKTFSLDANVTFAPWPVFDIPSSDINVFVNGTGATYNKPTGLYAIDCDRTKAPVITLNIGGEGDYTDTTTQTLDLTGDDYIRYSEDYDICYLGARFYNGNGYWYIGSEVLNNHCISYNLKDKTIGFADSKVHMTTY